MSTLTFNIDLKDPVALNAAQALLDAFRNNGPAAPAAKTAAKPVASAKAAVTAPEAATAEPVTETTEDAAEEVTVEQMREAIAPFATTKRAEIKALITSFGADKLQNIAPAKRAEFIEKVKAL